VQCASRRACPINIQQQQWCWSYAAGWCLCRHAQNSQTVHSVPSATGSCAEDGDLVAGAIGGARHRTDQWIEPGMRVHYTGSFCARPVKRTAIRDLDQTVSSCPGSSCHICKKERTTQNVNLGPAYIYSKKNGPVAGVAFWLNGNLKALNLLLGPDSDCPCPTSST